MHFRAKSPLIRLITFASFSPRRSLLLSVLFMPLGCSTQLLLPAAPDFRTQPRPRGSGQHSWTQGVRSTTKGESRKRTEESLLSSGRFRLSPATGAGGQGHSQFYSIDFHVTTQPSLVLSWAPRKYRPPFVPLLPTKKRRPHQQEAALYLSKKFVYSASATVPRISRGTSLCRSAEAAPKHSTMQ